MHEVLIYTIGKMLYLHAHQVIINGKIQLLDSKRSVINEYPVKYTEFISHQLDVDPGKYIARFVYGNIHMEKSLTIY